jgi:hypothetical protein
VGPENASFVCPQRTYNEPCPICEARAELDRAGDDEGAKSLLPKKRVAMFIINRADEAKGAQLWCAPWTLEKDIALVALDEGGALALDDPNEGYDITFTRDKQGKDVPPKYVGVKAARRPSPALDDEDKLAELLDWLVENPITDCIVNHGYEAIEKAFGDGPAPHSGGNKGEALAKKKATPEASAPSKKKKVETPPPDDEEEDTDNGEDLPTWDDLLGMGENELVALAEEAELEGDDVEFDDLSHMRKWIAEQLGIEVPVKPAKPAKPALKKKAAPPAEDEDDEEEAAPPPKKGPDSGAASWKSKMKALSKR